eukprot:Clim_evm46s148 gene=Clim_evmTU46s148
MVVEDLDFWITSVVCILGMLVLIAWRLEIWPLSSPRSRLRCRHGTERRILVVLGSGGHTTEMLNVLDRMPLLSGDRFCQDIMVDALHRLRSYHFTFVYAADDQMSARKGEAWVERHALGSSLYKESHTNLQTPHDHSANAGGAGGTVNVRISADLIPIPRARAVRQSWLTVPFTVAWSLLCSAGTVYRCIVRDGGTDLVLVNGPGTCVPVMCWAYLFKNMLKLFGPFPYHDENSGVRLVFLESICRTATLSLSGKLLRPFVDTFVVQWPALLKVAPGSVYFGGPVVI